MDIEARDKLIAAIDALGTSAGVALERLAHDLAGRDKPLKLTYADLGAFDAGLAGLLKKTSIAGIDSADYNFPPMASRIREALDKAFEAGVLITQDTVKERVR